MQIAVLSHRGGNIGHEFMALGMERMLRATFGADLSIDHFEQHRHFDVLPSGHPLRLVDRMRQGRGGLLRRFLDRRGVTRWTWAQARDLRGYSLVVACGGPNVIRGAADSAELNLMFHQLYGSFLAQGRKVLDLAIGSCFPLERLPRSAEEAFTPQDVVTYKRLLDATSFTTVRDPLAQMLVRDLGREAPVIGCTAVATGRLFGEATSANGSSKEPPIVLINYQRKGANEDWGQGVDVSRWAEEVKRIATSMSRRHQVVFICHNDAERRIAEALQVDATIIVPRDWREYAHWASRAKVALVSRVHAALPLAGLGVPSLAIGTDSRLMALQTVGIRTAFVKDVNATDLEATLEEMIANRADESARLEAKVDSTMQAYRDIFEHWVERP